MAKANTYPSRTLANVYGEDASGSFGKSSISPANLSAVSDPLSTNDSTQGYAVGSIWQNATTGRVFIARSVTASNAVWMPLELSDHPGYISSNWYIASLGSALLQNGTAPGSGSIRLYPAYVKQRVTLNTLGVRVSTLSAGGLVQAAIYANNAATMRPTGNALASTASMSTTNVANVNAAVSIQLEPGLYWWATNCDNGTAAFGSFNATSVAMNMIIGSTAQNSLQGGGLVGLSVAQAFGTWPDLTSGSFTDVPAATTIPIVQFKIASVP